MNIATILNSEISRIARLEARAESAEVKKITAQYRLDITELKRRVSDLERLLSRQSMSSENPHALTALAKPKKAAKTEKAIKPTKAVKVPKTVASTAVDDQSSKVRFSAKGLATQRQRLGLSAANMGKILGVSGGAVYLWEDGKTRPRVNQLPAIANLRKLGKKEVTAKLLALETGVEVVAE
jgi:DNA-binding transcriptional regulator YiaG